MVVIGQHPRTTYHPVVEHIDALAALVGREGLIVDPDLRASYETDWTRRWRGRCDAVIRPADTAEVAAVLRWCSTHDVVVVPQGGNTGLVAGGVPPADNSRRVVVVSTRRIDVIEPLDAVAGRITVGAGVTLGRLEQALRGSGWEVGVDLAARDSATIGGMAATNAGGMRVVRHGMMRRNVTGLETVLADGSVLTDLRGLEKDNTGYDISSLMVGSEGTLGVITRVQLRLVPVSADRVTVLVACDGWGDAVHLAARLRRIDGVEALEAVDHATVSLVAEFGHTVRMPTASTAVIVEWRGNGEPPTRLVDEIGDRVHEVATEPAGRDALWTVREGATECIALAGIPHKFDVTVPLGEIPDFCERVASTVAAAGHRLFVFGHVGDGNLHVNVLGPAPDDTEIDRAVLESVGDCGGSISAEHGIGRAKRDYLHLARSEAEQSAFRAVKDAFDPRRVMNPGVILPD
jgi:FAD/FMN-containing dehydrogenase